MGATMIQAIDRADRSWALRVRCRSSIPAGREVIEPQPGPQTEFLRSKADVVFYGGAAGGGKTWALLLESLRNVGNPGFAGVIFRRTSPQITAPGGLWDESAKLYTRDPIRGKPREHVLEWGFPSGAVLKFSHMEHERNRLDWQGSQMALIGWDELTHFTRTQFLYLFSRNRSTCGVRPYIRGTCNPVPPDDGVGGWIHEFVGWYIGPDGYALPERSGRVRWFVNVNDELHWADSSAELAERFPTIPPKSFTFIASSIYDNRKLLEVDPGYLANLHALDPVERARLLGDGKRGGNWLIKPAAGKVVNRAWFEVVDAAPAGGRTVRGWDLAATKKQMKGDDPDFTATVKTKMVDGILYVLDCDHVRMDAVETDRMILSIASQDGREVAQRFEQEGGSSGKRDAHYIVSLLAGYDVATIPPTGDKLARGRPFAAQAAAGNVKIVRGEWNNTYLSHLHAYPDGAHDDIWDANSVAANDLMGGGDEVRVYSRRRRF
jgi:predicted phage terminase large subunit-like protein